MSTKLSWSKCIGAIHHAQWMRAAISILKMLIVGSDYYRMGISKAHGVVDLSFFIIYVYSCYWFSIPVASDAPFLALMLWKDFKLWVNCHQALSSTCLRKLDQHTLYLSPRHIPSGLFSKRVDETKCGIVKAMQNNLLSQVQIAKSERPHMYEDSTLESFVVSSEPWLLFQLLRVHLTFFGYTLCKEWKLNSSFLQLQNVVSGLKVVNDPAEHSVKFGGDYTDIITTDEAR